METVNPVPERVLRRPHRVRSLLMVVLALGLTLGVFAASPGGQAQAAVIQHSFVPPVLPVGLLGAGADAATGAAASSVAVSGPIGWAVAAGVLAIYLGASYATGSGPFDGQLWDSMLGGSPKATTNTTVGRCDLSIGSGGSVVVSNVVPGYGCSFKIEMACGPSGGDAGYTWGPITLWNQGNQTNSDLNCGRLNRSTLSVTVLDWMDGAGAATGPGTYVSASGGNDPGTEVTATKNCVDNVTGAPVASVAGSTSTPNTMPGVGDCPAGSYPGSIDFTAKTPTGTPRSLGSVANHTATDFPECAAGCAHTVKIDGVTCHVGLAACYNWQAIAPERVACEYGPYAVGLAECDALRDVYKSAGGLTLDRTNPDWHPVPSLPDGTPDPNKGVGTQAPPDWNPVPPIVPQPIPTSAPVPTSAPTPTSAPNPTGTPTPTPTGGGLPTVGTNPTPGGAPIPDPENPSQSCLAAMWSWNPIDWVFTPVKCALVWAFVPKPGAMGDAMAEAKGDLLGRPPVSVAVALSVPLVALVGTQVDGCSNQLADFGGGLRIPCAPPGDPGWAQALYAVMACAVVVASCLYAWSMIQGAMHKAGGE